MMNWKGFERKQAWPNSLPQGTEENHEKLCKDRNSNHASSSASNYTSLLRDISIIKQNSLDLQMEKHVESNTNGMKVATVLPD
jgi:hypothetical protein